MWEQLLQESPGELGKFVVQALVDAARKEREGLEQALDKRILPVSLGHPELTPDPLMLLTELFSLLLEEVVLALEVLLDVHFSSLSHTTLDQPVVENSVNRTSVSGKSLMVAWMRR